jgi:stage III sporulation protein AB
MFLKAVCSMVILLCSTAGGLAMAARFPGRVNHIRMVQQALNMLESEILFTSTPLPEAFQRVAQRIGRPLDRVFFTVLSILDENAGYTAGEAWNMAFERNRGVMLLNSEDLDIIKAFGKGLGSTDRENQQKIFHMIRFQLDSQLVKAEDDRSKNEKMYKNLGFLLGVTIIILLI